MLSDQELMQQTAAGDLQAFAALVERYRERLERFLYRLSGDREEAADCAQEALVKLWLRRREYRPQAQFTTYLYTIARHVWLDRAKRERRRPPVTPLEAQLGPAGRAMLERLVGEAAPVEAEVMRRYQVHRVRRAMQGLSEKHRTVFILSHFEDLSHEQIAEIVGASVGTVKSRMHYALVHLRRALQEEEQLT